MQLVCDGKDCSLRFPPDGAVDAAIFALSELRFEAKLAGWKRTRGCVHTFTGTFDFCRQCAALREKGRK